MPILIPNKSLVRPTTTPVIRCPAIAKEAITNPQPVRVSATGSSGPKNPLVERTRGENGNRGYLGYNLTTDVPEGASSDEEALAVVRGVYIEGFTGVTPGLPIFVDPAAKPDPEADFSGLTHTDPTGQAAIGEGLTTTKIFIYP